MNILSILNDNDFEPVDYIDRPTVKAVIVNDNDEVLLFGGSLPGGGVEEGETNDETLRRECMEEIGAFVSIENILGSVIQYRDDIKRKYSFVGYRCSLVSITEPTTTLENEIGKKVFWEKREEAIKRLEDEIKNIKQFGKEEYGLERYQSGIFNRLTAILFLKEIK